MQEDHGGMTGHSVRSEICLVGVVALQPRLPEADSGDAVSMTCRLAVPPCRDHASFPLVDTAPSMFGRERCLPL